MTMTTSRAWVLFYWLSCAVLSVESFVASSGRNSHNCKQRSGVSSTTTSSSSATSTTSLFVQTVEKTDEEWNQILTPEQFYVLRKEGTEAPNTSVLNSIKEDGTFSCAGCGAPLFTTVTKFESGTGWPSFYAPLDSNAIELTIDFKLILPRTECSCGACGGHLGHVFDDGPDPTGQRYCLNGVAMAFESDLKNPELASTVAERQQAAPYQIGLMQLVPSVMVNGIMGGLFFNGFVTRLEQGGGLSSPLDLFPLLPALYFGVLATRACGRLSSS
jgi:peptide-methionine (R)-S-oxide reductase